MVGSEIDVDFLGCARKPAELVPKFVVDRIMRATALGACSVVLQSFFPAFGACVEEGGHIVMVLDTFSIFSFLVPVVCEEQNSWVMGCILPDLRP